MPSTRITVTNTAGSRKSGRSAIGRVLDLGVTANGTNISIEDYSPQERDGFCNAIIVERAFAQLIDYPRSKYHPNRAARLQKHLGRISHDPCRVDRLDDRKELRHVGLSGY